MKTERKVHDLTRIGSVGVKIAGDLDNIKFNFFMGCLLREKKEDLFRSKGVLSIHEQGDTKFVFQGVHETINFGPAATPWPEGEKRVRLSAPLGWGRCTTHTTRCLHSSTDVVDGTEHRRCCRCVKWSSLAGTWTAQHCRKASLSACTKSCPRGGRFCPTKQTVVPITSMKARGPRSGRSQLHRCVGVDGSVTQSRENVQPRLYTANRLCVN